jgi:putative transposase
MKACCALYNGALEERRSAWRKHRRHVGWLDQQRSLTEIRAADPEWAAIPVDVARSALRRLDKAMKAFFRRCKSGESPGFPRFRSSKRYNSFDVNGYFRIVGDRVYLPRVGAVRFKKYREPRGRPRNAIVRREGERWFVYFQCDLGAAPAKADPVSTVGLDVGLLHLATLSTGETFENHRRSRSAEATLARHQRSMERKKIESNARRRAVERVRRAHDHVRNQRIDHARKIACVLVRRFDLIAFEDLNIRTLAKGFLGKSVNDASWRVLLHAIACKAESAGKHAVAVPARGTSQECSSCGVRVQKDLSERTHRCSCGCVLDRDHNAALNILARGRRAVSEAVSTA